MKENSEREPPQILADLNANLKPPEITVETIAEKIGISKTTLYRWMEVDIKFQETLQTLKEVQENDPFKTGTEEDSMVNATIIALLLLETKDLSTSQN
jgi:transposase-like protein